LTAKALPPLLLHILLISLRIRSNVEHIFFYSPLINLRFGYCRSFGYYHCYRHDIEYVPWTIFIWFLTYRIEFSYDASAVFTLKRILGLTTASAIQPLLLPMSRAAIYFTAFTAHFDSNPLNRLFLTRILQLHCQYPGRMSRSMPLHLRNLSPAELWRLASSS
jgi:hypothetical protein